MKKRRLNAAAAVLKGLASAVGATLIGMLIMTAAVIFLGMSDAAIRAANQFLKISAVFLGTFLAVGRGGERGLVTGAALGIIYAFAGYMLYICLGGGVFDPAALMGEMTICLAAGGACGVMCANMKKRRKAA